MLTGVLGIAWGADADAVRARFGGLRPAVVEAEQIAYPLSAVAERLEAEGAFCPTALLSGPERSDDDVAFRFDGGALVQVTVRFGYGYSVIGQHPDRLSEQAMAAFTRAEMQRLVFELAARHGAPAWLTDAPMWIGNLHAQCAAAFRSAEGTMLHVFFGHDGEGLAGELCYLPPVQSAEGF